jgi:hypothetical protein
MLLITFVELHLVPGRSRTRAGRPHAVSGRPMLIDTCHAMSMPRCAVALRDRFQNGMVVAWRGRGMACVYQTRPHCVNQMERHSLNPQRRGMGTAWYVWISLKSYSLKLCYSEHMIKLVVCDSLAQRLSVGQSAEIASSWNESVVKRMCGAECS